MEQQTNGEQPESIASEEVCENNQTTQSEVEQTETQNEDGSLGKFKNSEALLSAYNNLQAEFTRKCQKLSEYEKSEGDKQTDLQVEEKDWNKEVTKFLSKNTNAKQYAKEIASEILSDKQLQQKQDALDIAWAKVIQKVYKKPEEIMSPNFIEQYIQQNSDAKQKLLETITKELQQNKVPKMVSSQTSGNIVLPKFTPPKNLYEAKEMARKLFE